MLEMAELKESNRTLRAADDSHLWPISGKFNATDRAIRRVRKAMSEGLDIETAEDYEEVVGNEVGRIVNNEGNWCGGIW